MKKFLNDGCKGGSSGVRATLLIILLLLISISAVRAQNTNEVPRHYLVLLNGDSPAHVFLKNNTNSQGRAASSNASGAAKGRASEIKAQHDDLSVRLKALGVKEIARHSKLLNAISVKATPSQVDAIRQLPGVKSVQRAQTYELNTASSVPFIGTTNVWGGTPAADGAGIRIGIIDTGIDY